MSTTRKLWKPKPKRKTGVETTHRAYCEPCAWRGPEREMESVAKADLDEHRKIAERYMYCCSKVYAKLVAEDKRKG